MAKGRGPDPQHPWPDAIRRLVELDWRKETLERQRFSPDLCTRGRRVLKRCNRKRGPRQPP
jgi:hypothetical protein